MEKIKLSQETLPDLYKNNLVLIDDHEFNETPSPSIHDTSTTSANIHTGGYQKKILWIHEEPDHPFLSDDDHEMITKILDACKLSWQEIALVNMSNISKSIKNVLNDYSPNFLILTLPDQIHLFETYRSIYSVVRTSSETILITDRLKDIRQNKDLKIKLWHSLKEMFEL